MALYDNYLNQNNLYSRPSSLVSDVNNYLGANQAKLPLSSDSLGNMANLKTDTADPYFTSSRGQTITKDANYDDIIDPEDLGKPKSEGDIYGSGKDLVAEFVKKLGVLDESQQGLLLEFIGTDGVSSEEYAKLFGVDEEYSNRFQGLPNFLDIGNQLANVSAYGAQQRGYEMDAAQQAQIASSAGGRGRLVGGPGQDDTRRRTMINTLTQRLSGVKEATAGKYNQILQNVQNTLKGAFQTQADIYASGASERDPTQDRYSTGETIEIGGVTYYHYQGDWLTEDEWNDLEGVDV